MKIIIFADKSYNYIRPLADGLHNTLLEMGHESLIWYDGIYWLQKLNLWKIFFADIYRFFHNLIYRDNLYILRFWNLLTFFNKKKINALNQCDCIIVVYNCPSSFIIRERLDSIRKRFKKPIVNYDFHYLPNQGWWARIKEMPNHRGLEQFDWYLPVGLVTEFAIPTSIPKIYNCIGMDINSHELKPGQNEFIVLLDFPRPGHEVKRIKEKQILDSIGVKYIELNGRYTRSQIREIYRKISAYIVSSRESFGLPIVELQLCGAKVLTPHIEWVPAHYLNKSPFENGIGELGNNFIVFNGEEGLKTVLKELKKSCKPELNIRVFKKEYPTYDRIDKSELSKFLSCIQQKKINAITHLEFEKYNELISTSQDYESSDIV